MTSDSTGADRPTDPVPVDLRDYVLFDADRPAGRRVYASDALALDLVCLEPRQTVAARTLRSADVVYTVLGGRAWVVTAETEVTLEPLQAVMVPAGVPHGLRNDSADPLILQAVVSPPGDAPAAFEGPVERGAVAGRTAGGARMRRQASRPDLTGKPGLLDRLRKALGG